MEHAMRSFLITCAVLSTASVAIAIAASGCSSASCDDTNTCGLTDTDGATADGQGGDGMTGEGGGDGGGDSSRDADGGASDAPSDSIADRSDGFDGFTCDVAKTPKDDNCVLLGFLNTGVFVAPYGTTGAAGTAAAPVDTINTALTKAKAAGLHRIYVCGGTYTTAATLDGATVDFDVQIFGGLTCPGAGGDAGTPWTYTAAATVVAPTAAGYGLSITNVTKVVGVSDIEFDSIAATGQDANGAGKTSIAGWVNGSGDVTFTRATFRAGDGSAGADGGAFATNRFGGTLTGNGANGVVGAGRLTCSCPVSGSTSGGNGGNGGISRAETGGDGTSVVRVGYGLGGTGGKTNPMPPPLNLSCQAGGTGDDGVGGTSGTGATTNGSLGSSGWTPAAGLPGGVGGVAQGGGGGGGSVSLAGGAGGGGGACGGCGGGAGQAGKGGGSSFALVVLSSTVKLNASKLFSGAAGKGGNGSTGESGQGGGGGGGTIGACSGGDGGNGAGGGGGGGGAGGLSLGIAWSGATAPTVDGTMQTNVTAIAGVYTAGTGGGAGTHGNGGAASANGGNAGQNGTDGVAGSTSAVKQF